MKILIAYDGSECSDAAIVDLRRAGLPAIAEAMVLTVSEICPQVAAVPYGAVLASPEMFLPGNLCGDPWSEYPMEDAHTLASRAADRLRADFPEWHIQQESWVDAAESSILRMAHAWKPDLIVVGSHGRSTIGRLVLGSVSQYILYHVPCSVRISRHHLHPQDRPIRVIIGVDGSASSCAAVRAVAARNWPAGTEVRAVGVLDNSSLLGSPFTVTPEAVPAAIEEKWRSEISNRLHQASDLLKPCRVIATTQILGGAPTALLLAEAEKYAADCIFLGAGGAGAVQRILLGSVSTAVAAQAHCSVEVIRAND